MDFDLTHMHTLNMCIGQAESNGDRAFFEDLLAPAFAMRRANGTVENRGSFLEGVRSSSGRATEVTSISLLRADRAVVTCVVAQNGRRYDNFRLFVRESGSPSWKLLAWANEPFPIGSA
jgi:hypothetical protein